MALKEVQDLLKEWEGSLPVDPSALAVKHGISVLFEKDMVGTGKSDLSDKVIWVNPDEPKFLQRFAVARELGRFILVNHNPDKGVPDREANVFAAELLMPEDLITRFEETGTLRQLAWIFDVSTTAVFYRLKMLGLR